MRRVLMPVPGLDVSRPWQVGGVTFHPAGSASRLIEVARASEQTGSRPAFEQWLAARRDVLDASAIAEVDEREDAVAAVTASLSVMRVVQYIENPMNDKRRQTFGLPGDVATGVLDYVVIGDSVTAGASRVGALAGWDFSDEDHAAWSADPAYRFLDEALRTTANARSGLQQRALTAAALLSQAWLALDIDVSLLNTVMALEVLLGETDDRAKKFRLARRVAYFVCGWPTEFRHFDGTRPLCSYMTLPLGGQNGPLAAQIKAVQSGAVPPECTWFYDVLGLYDARNSIVHDGRLDRQKYRSDLSTEFVGAILLRPVLSWFAAHPAEDLTKLDDEIASRS